jgi:hypothetical protein
LIKKILLLSALAVGFAAATPSATQTPAFGIFPKTAVVQQNSSYRFRTYADSQFPIQLRSRDTSVARIMENGLVRGRRPGKAWIVMRGLKRNTLGFCLANDSALIEVRGREKEEPLPTVQAPPDVRNTEDILPSYRHTAVPGITPKVGAIAHIGTTFQFTVVSVAPVDATVISRDTLIATVDDDGLATGVNEGDTWIIASVFNGHCTVQDSARISVVDTTTVGEIEGDSARGRVAWLASCQSCHTHDKPIDMETFDFPDTAIVRRAMNHVDTTTALDIVEFKKTLGAGGPLTRTTVIYQPGTPATAVANDSLFAVALWGADEWRASITRDSLLATHIKDVRIPITLPLWSDEATAYDWVPGTGPFNGQLRSGVLNSALVQNALAQYRANPTIQNAGNLAGKISNSAHNEAIPDAPCVYNASNWQTRFDSTAAQACADHLKWGANLMYQTGVASGLHPDTIIKRSEGVWWETGHMFHKAQQRGRNIELRSLQTCAWIYLGSLWTGAARSEASLYMTGPCGGGSSGLNHKRWASWMTMYMMVRRTANDKGSTEACRDIWSMTDHGHSTWFATSVAFGLREMMYRLDNGFQTSGSQSECTANSASTSGSIGNAGYLGQAMTLVNNKAGAGVFNALKPLADSVRARINAL